MAQENLAVIDLGTNSCRLMITDKHGKILYRESIATKLGEGMYEHMRFTPQAIERGVNAFAKYAELLKKYEVGTYRAIATASCRMASNGMDFVAEVKQKTGVCVEVIDGEEEALVNLKGALMNAPKNSRYAIVYDLGGGSTEITLATNEDEPKIIYTVSIPWGGRNSAEAFELVEYSEKNKQKLQKEIADYVAEFVRIADLEKYRDNCCLLATSSTSLRLVSMVKGWGGYERDKSDGVTVMTAELDKVIKQVWAMSLDQRRQSPYIGENRAPIFISACTIFKSIYDGLGFKELTASLKSAQDGIIEEIVKNGKVNKVG